MTDSTALFAGHYNTPHDTFPFDRITTADIKPAIMAGIEAEKAEVRAIVENPDAPTFANTIEALEKSGELLNNVTTYMYNMLSAHADDALQDLAQEMSPILSEHSANIMLNPALFDRVRSVKQGATEYLSPEARMLLDKLYEGFERSGATLDDACKARFRAITAELSSLTLTFSQNVLKETNAFTLHITDEEDLRGLPPMQVEQAAAAAKEVDKEGWIITLHAPSYVPFMTYAENRELRRKLYMAYNTRCTRVGEHCNYEVVRRLVNLRQELAQLLGYRTYADYVLRRRMAQDVEHVYGLLDGLMAAYRPQAEKEVAEVVAQAKAEQGDDFVLQPWDFTFYAHRLKKARYDIDAEMLRPYFELGAVAKGIFGLATTLYGITFKENKDIPVYHPEVKAYEVFDRDGRFLAVLYTDFHPRSTKQGGAWMTNYREEWERVNRPHVAITMNLTKPTAEKPALLTLSEVETFLHEFGHALHSIFADTKYSALSGTNVYWDFVELPSQFMENYAVERDFLRTFARHYETGELIPDELIQRVVDSRNFNAAYACMRQVSFGLLDMAYYTLDTPLEGNVLTFERKAWHAAQLLPEVDDCCMSVQFGHIMAGGYSAGYYSYKWAEVLDADAFHYFKAHGIFNQEIAQRFRENILSKGGTQPPMELYLAFRGQAPTIDALLERNGIK